jgi:hypothetical protein
VWRAVTFGFRLIVCGRSGLKIAACFYTTLSVTIFWMRDTHIERCLRLGAEARVAGSLAR